MGMEPGTSDGKIKVDEHYPLDTDEPPPFDIKRIENIRSNVKFETCYEISKHIGDGKFGKVFQVKEKSTGQEFAAKFIRIRKEADRKEVEREVSILTSLRHPRIAQIYDAFYTTTNDVVLIMEIVRGGELFDRVADENYVLTEMAVVMIICQLCEAIEYIHQQNILHLDIKPENIMCVSQTGNRIKLIDFGLARHYDGNQELKYMAGTPEFAAPEVIKFEKLDYHTDMWSVGVITYILLSGYSPFLGDNLGETYCNVERGVWEFTEEFDSVSEEAKDFVSHLLIYDQRKRMLPAQCLEHPWIAKHRAKARCDRQLEKHQEGPKIDNKMHMRYNAKRKFRRMVIYVKFLIEMNRLRNSLRERMSENGQKFFDPLLRMAEAKEKKIELIIHGDKKPKLEIPKIVEEVEETKKPDVEEKKKKKRTSIKPSEATELVVPSKKDHTSDSEGSVKSAKSDASEKKKKVKTEDTTKKLVKKGSTDSSDAVTVVVKKPKLKKEASKATEGEKSDAEKTPRKKSFALSDSETQPKKKSDANSDTLITTADKVKKVSIPTLMVPEVTKKSSSSSDLMNVFKMPVLKLKESKSVESKLNLAVDEPKKSLEKKKNSTPEVVLNAPPRKTTLTPSKSLDHTKATDSPVRNGIEKKTVEKTERSDSTKENQNADEKKPVRMGALKKKKSENGEVIKKKKSVEHVETTNTIQNLVGNKEVSSLETNIVKRKSITSNPEEGQKSVVTSVETKKLSSPRGSLLLAKLQKFDSDATPLTLSVAATKKPVFDDKSEALNTKETPTNAKIIKVTTEKQTTTTKSTTTSIRRKSSTTEKKVQHTSDGKTVEQVEIRNCNEDNLKISQVTTKKEESPELPNPVTTVKKRLIKKDTSKTTTEKNRKEEETVNDVNTVKTTKSVQDTGHKKLSLEESTKSTGGPTKQLLLAGSTTVTKKVEGKVTEETTPRRKSIKKSEATISSKVKETLDFGKDDAKRSLQKNCTTLITITPDTEEKVHTPTGTRKKSSICLSVPSKSISRDSSEERKRVHFADVVLHPTPMTNGLQRMKSESSIPARMKISSKTEVKLTKDDGEIKKKKKLIASKSTELPYVPKEEFRFEDLKQQLERRCSMEPLFNAGRKSPTALISSSSVKDRLKKFENKFS